MEKRDVYGNITKIEEEIKKKKEWPLSKYLFAVNTNKKKLFKGETKDLAEKEYIPFLINRYFSFNAETILFANEMNIYSFLDKDIQFEFYRSVLRKSSRRIQWIKSVKDDDIKLIMEYFHYNQNKAKEVSDILGKKGITYIKNKLSKGGFK